MTYKPRRLRTYSVLEYPLDLESVEREKKRYDYLKKNAELVWMSPNEFLSEVPHPSGVTMYGKIVPAIIDLDEKHFTKSSIKKIEEKIDRGQKLEPLMLDYTNIYYGYPSHEGRHRAFVAKKRGIEKVPVIVVK